MHRRAYWYPVFGLAAAAVAVAAYALAVSLGPNAAANAGLLTIDTSKLELGAIAVVDVGGERYYVSRTSPDQIRVLAVPTRNGKVQMPDLNWWRAYLPCKDFGPDLENGKLMPQSRYRCRDSDVGGFYARVWVWDTEGHAVRSPAADPDDTPVDDMPSLPVEPHVGYVTVRRRR